PSSPPSAGPEPAPPATAGGHPSLPGATPAADGRPAAPGLGAADRSVAPQHPDPGHPADPWHPATDPHGDHAGAPAPEPPAWSGHPAAPAHPSAPPLPGSDQPAGHPADPWYPAAGHPSAPPPAPPTPPLAPEWVPVGTPPASLSEALPGGPEFDRGLAALVADADAAAGPPASPPLPTRQPGATREGPATPPWATLPNRTPGAGGRSPEPPPAEGPPTRATNRSPEEVRAMLSNYRAGLSRGRSPRQDQPGRDRSEEDEGGRRS
ncbi:MAG TPA: hypothetical protein VF640_02700, partial [Acidimicrobiales bacterium]